MIEILDTLSVCPDCACWIANADDSALDLYDDADSIRSSRDAGIAALTANGEQLVSGDSDNYNEFSWRNCEICGALPGARMEVVLLSA